MQERASQPRARRRGLSVQLPSRVYTANTSPGKEGANEAKAEGRANEGTCTAPNVNQSGAKIIEPVAESTATC